MRGGRGRGGGARDRGWRARGFARGHALTSGGRGGARVWTQRVDARAWDAWKCVASRAFGRWAVGDAWRARRGRGRWDLLKP